MKIITFITFGIVPMALFAKAPVIFIVWREQLCWYYKINKMVSNQEEIIRLLKLIADRDNSKINQENKEIIIDPFHKK